MKKSKKKPAAKRSKPSTANKPAAQNATASAPAAAKEAPAKQQTVKPTVIELQPGKTKLVLHVGCGDKERGSGLHKNFQGKEWQEVRLDIEPRTYPDIVADMTNMPQVESGKYDAVWSSHNIEHVWAHEVEKALDEFYRVLKTDGVLLLATPDVQKVAEGIVKKGLEDPLYESPSGPIAALDMLYGHRPSIQNGFYTMAHKTGFTAKSLGQKFLKVGFRDVVMHRDNYNLWGQGFKRAQTTKKNNAARIIQPDVNEMMKKRDEIDQEPGNAKAINEALAKFSVK